MNDTKRLIFGGFSGGFVALIFGLAVSYQYGYGPLLLTATTALGSLIGWAACDLAGVKRSVKIAWRQIVGWKPDIEWWKESLLDFATLFSLLFAIFFWVFSPAMLSPASRAQFPIFLVVSVIISAGMAVIGSAINLVGDLECASERPRTELCKSMLIRWNFMTAPFSVLWHAGRGILWCLPKVPAAFKTAKKFAWKLFVLAHSDIRQVCAIGTAIGTFTGYVLAWSIGGNLIVFALIGGALCAGLSVIWWKLVVPRILGCVETS